MARVLVGREGPIDDSHGKAIYYMEKLFPYFEGRFDIHGSIKKSNLPEEEKKLARRLVQEIENIMIHEEGYASLYPDANCWRKLTPRGRKFQDEICQQLLFDKLKQSRNYTIPIVHGMGVLLNGKQALIDKEIIVETTSSNNVKSIRLNSEVTGASNVKEAIRILERKNAIPITSINYHGPVTNGNGSHISGRDTIINEPDEEQNEIAKQGLNVSKKSLFWTIFGVIVAIITILISCHQ
ncbi:hypothetical protein FC093_06845 [Ilyomonas limi]|uniref:Uncharacterized protein n=1 Tax=Ilyomonas limi TaxID=2575867 RepID=A0A4U3L3P9_9BACT|nr:hypothetical protein [Ilyomonas limi]TKK69791.1 hypothetical protein FC093_06845 [Ilyomonas limi]